LFKSRNKGLDAALVKAKDEAGCWRGVGLTPKALTAKKDDTMMNREESFMTVIWMGLK
jgi:hypothetical protein